MFIKGFDSNFREWSERDGSLKEAFGFLPFPLEFHWNPFDSLFLLSWKGLNNFEERAHAMSEENFYFHFSASVPLCTF